MSSWIDDNCTTGNASAANLSLATLHAVIEDLAAQLSDLEVSVPATHNRRAEAINTIWLFVCFVELVTLQIGFAMREAGLVREKSMATTYAKNLLGAAQNAVMCLLVTYNLAYPKAQEHVLILGTRLHDHHQRKSIAFHIMSQTMVCSIISGAMAERTTVVGAFILNALVGLLQACIVRMTWGGGFLAEMSPPFLDANGAGPVHAVGGAVAVVGALIVGSRKGRWSPVEKGSFVPHSLAMTTTGLLLIWIGWFGYIQITRNGSFHTPAGINEAAIRATNAITSSAVSGLVAVVVSLIRSKGDSVDMIGVCNSILAGLVAMTGGCNILAMKWALLVGGVAAVLVVCMRMLSERFEVDDVSQAGAIHGMSGSWGVIAVGLFHHSDGFATSGSCDLLWSQLFGLFILVGVSSIAGVLALETLHCFGLLRISSTTEAAGLDMTLSFDAYVKSKGEMSKLREAAGIITCCGHHPGDVLAALTILKRIIHRPFAPHSPAKKKEGEVDDILDQLDPDTFEPDMLHFIRLVHQGTESSIVAKEFGQLAEGGLVKRYEGRPRARNPHLMHNLIKIEADHIMDPVERMTSIDKSQNVVVLLTRQVFTDPWCIAEIVHAASLSKRLLSIFVEFEHPEIDRRALRFPHDLEREILKWEEFADDICDERPYMETLGSRLRMLRRLSGSSGDSRLAPVSETASRSSARSQLSA